MNMRVPWFDVFALAVLGLLLLATAPRSAEADDKALGADRAIIYGFMFYFEDEEDATAFKLRWG